MTKDNRSHSTLEAAQNYRRRGYWSVPIPHGQKGTTELEWPDLRLDGEELERRFDAPCNIGIILGEPSGWLVDVDLDCAEAVELANRFLPPTGMISGRESRPGSHRWYIVEGAETKPLRDRVSRKMVVELRSTGLQTVVGPSVHPDGDMYTELTGDPAVVPAEMLAACVLALFNEIQLQRHGPETSNIPPTPTATDRQHVRHENDEHVQARAAAYLDNVPPAISGQNGHGQTYAAATAMVHGFGLDPEVAFELLWTRYNPRCEPPWTHKELRHKVDDAASKPHEMPLGWLRDAESFRHETSTDSSTFGADGLIRLGHADPTTGRLVLSPKRTLPTAEAYISHFNTHADGRTLHCFGGQLVEWRGNRYEFVSDNAIQHRLQPWLHRSLRVVPMKNGKPKLCDFESNPATVKQALETIRNYTHISGETPCPFWLDSDHDHPPANEILSCPSLNLRVTTGEVFLPSPLFFSFNAINFDYDPDPEPPEKWIRFLEELFGDDIESVNLLQEWFGYCLVSDSSHQKMLLMVGPKRSGKGTIGRLLQMLVGASNVVGPTTGSLATNFGLQPLIGKSLAIVSDARFTGSSVATVVERLLCISGEDTLTIDRKHLGAVSMRLPTRFVFLTNELPRLADSSNALASRFLVLRLEKSFYGHEDLTLLDQLKDELPGVLKWSLDGLARLRQRGQFLQPESCQDAILDLEDLGSPVSLFVKERCEVGHGCRTYLDEIYPAWRLWCESDGRVVISPKSTFARDLIAAFPSVKSRRDSDQNRFYDGIQLTGRVL